MLTGGGVHKNVTFADIEIMMGWIANWNENGILKNIPHAVNTRLSSISANEDVFNKACPPYQEALEKVDMTSSSNFPHQTRTKRRKVKTREMLPISTPLIPKMCKQI